MSATPIKQTAAKARTAIEPVSMSLYDTDFQAFAERLGASFRRYGFAVVSDHGLDETVIAAAIEDAKAFFALPEQTKRQYHQPGTGGARGLTPFGVEAAKGVGRAFVLSTYLCNELGYEGNHERYSDPKNSYLNCVIESRRGIPVSLCTLFLLLGRRLGLPVFGVNMPAHFLVKYEDERHEVFFDIFNGGNPIQKEQCVQFLLKAGLTPKPRYFKAASGQTILIRMVCNLLALPREETRGTFLTELTHLVEPWKPNTNVL